MRFAIHPYVIHNRAVLWGGRSQAPGTPVLGFVPRTGVTLKTAAPSRPLLSPAATISKSSESF
jgi:hypothetical protein